MEEYALFQIAVKALVFNPEGKILFLKDFKGEWDLPGGRINYGETYASALARECKEELGVNCKVLKKTPDYVWNGQNTDGAWRIDLCFKVELESENFVATEENVEHEYFTIEEARKLNLSSHLNNLKEIFE